MDHSAMTREEIRRENARALAKAVGGLAEFGRRTSMENSQVSQIIGKTPTKNIGNMIAKRIEAAFTLSTGALDSPLSAAVHAPVSSSEPENDKANERETSAFQRHWLNGDEAELLSEYRSLTETGQKTLRIMIGRLPRADVSVSDAVDES